MPARLAMLPERLDFLEIGFSRDEDDLRCRNELHRKLRWPIGHDGVAVEIEIQQSTIDGVAQEVMAFVDDDPVWRARSPPHDVQRRQYRTDVLQLRLVFQGREIDDHAAVRIAQRVEERAWRRWRLFAAEHS